MNMRTALVLIMAFSLAGCSTYDKTKVIVNRPFRPTNVYRSDLIGKVPVRKVALFAFGNETNYGDIDVMVTESFRKKLTQRGFFEIKTAEFPALEESIRKGVVTKKLLSRAAKELGVDAVMVGTVTTYNPYRPIALGIRFKMVHIEKEAIIWAGDEVFDASYSDISTLAQRYYIMTQRFESPLENWESILNRPSLYVEFVCDMLAATYRPPAPKAS